MDMPESHEKAERGQMAEDGLAGASPEDQTAFPSNVEDQVPPAGLALTASYSSWATLPHHHRSSSDCLTSHLLPLLLTWRSARWSCKLGEGWCRKEAKQCSEWFVQVAEVRWYSMGVLMEELEEAVEGLQCHLHEYSRHLPDAAIKLYAKDHPAPEKDMLSP